MEKEKYVDESWKETAAQEKEILGTKTDSKTPQANLESSESSTLEPQDQSVPSDEQAMEVNFLNYITSLGFQAMIFLGEIPNPVTNEPQKNLAQAKFLIDTLLMLREKTKGNLSKQEEDFLNMSLYEIEMRYVASQKTSGLSS